MKKLLFLFFLLPQLVFSQYTASNGKTYNVGDTITIGKGSGIDNKFVNILIVHEPGPFTTNINWGMDSIYSGLKTIIKKIKFQKIARQTVTYFYIKMDKVDYLIFPIESAIESGEIK
jgi:hypothetical protein